MQKIISGYLIWVLLLGIAITSCKEEPLPEPEKEKEDIPQASDVNTFIWEGLATYYYWVEDVPNLVNPKFNNKDSLNLFLNKYNDPEELFYSLLYKYQEVDEWSFIVDDYRELDKNLAGINKSMGFEFKYGNIKDYFYPGYTGNADNICLIIIYVQKDSPAEQAGIKRGDYITKVNDIQLTESNWQELILNQENYSISLAELNAYGLPVENGFTYNLRAEVLQENPIHLDTILQIDNYKVGYLVYNGFTSAYDKKLETSYDLLLNNVFNNFKNEGIDKLVIDLRYNGGGDVSTAVNLASMIYSTDYNKVFARSKFNNLVEQYLIDSYGSRDSLNYYFSNKIKEKKWNVLTENGEVAQTVKTPEMSIISLNLNDLYVITSSWTASASELLINGLSPYISVKTIGLNTKGKNVAWTVIRDPYDDSYWSIQPIYSKIANSTGYAEYINGLPPDIQANENYKNLIALGNTEETLLNIALNDIRGIATKSVNMYFADSPLKTSKSLSPIAQKMFVEPIVF